jgi:hypothetical protein
MSIGSPSPARPTRPRARMCLGIGALLGAAAITAAPAQAAQTDFRVELESGQGTTEYAECFVGAKRLTCLLYNRPTEARCDFGGAVSTLVLTRAGRMRRTHTCVDEGSRDQPYLRPGRIFRAGGFTCRVIDAEAGAKQMRCLPKSGRGFSLDGAGTIRRVTGG